MQMYDAKCEADCPRKNVREVPTGCMVCGEDNPHSMGATFNPSGADGAETELVIPTLFQGFDRIAHGGTVAAVLDDAMWWAIFFSTGESTMTAQMTTRYHHPVRVAESLRVRGKMVSSRGRVFRTESHLLKVGEADGEYLASAEGTYLIPR